MSIATTGSRGLRFRSRLEARWASMFDALGWRWEYEPLDLNGWIPDFALTEADPVVLIEVKPALKLRDLQEPMPKIRRALPADGSWASVGYEVLLLGATPIIGEPGWNSGIGLLRDDMGAEATGRWMRCLECQRPSFRHEEQSFKSRICGHHDGDSYLGAVRDSEIDAWWAAASNAVQWNR